MSCQRFWYELTPTFLLHIEAKISPVININTFYMFYCRHSPVRYDQTEHVFTLIAPIATKVVCFSRLLKCLRSLYGKQCGPRSDCSYKSSLFWVHAVCLYTEFVRIATHLFATDNFSRRHFQMHFFSWRFKG